MHDIYKSEYYQSLKSKDGVDLLKGEVTTNKKMTEDRIRRLSDYMEASVLRPDGTVCCRYAERCEKSLDQTIAFLKGQMSHIGRHYDITIGGKELRIVIVGQEYGHGPAPCSLDERYEMIYENCGLKGRFRADGPHKARNPHMRGTTSALHILFGKEPGASWRDEFLVSDNEGDRFHIFDAFALVNALLCSAIKDNQNGKGAKSGKSSQDMQQCCIYNHFAATIRILEPTILVIQGIGIRQWISGLVNIDRAVDNHIQRAHIAGVPTILCSFSHPTARAHLRWGNVEAGDYLRKVVEPTLKKAIDLL